MKLSLLASALLQQTSGQGLGLVASGPTSRVSKNFKFTAQSLSLKPARYALKLP